MQDLCRLFVKWNPYLHPKNSSSLLWTAYLPLASNQLPISNSKSLSISLFRVCHPGVLRCVLRRHQRLQGEDGLQLCRWRRRQGGRRHLLPRLAQGLRQPRAEVRRRLRSGHRRRCIRRDHASPQSAFLQNQFFFKRAAWQDPFNFASYVRTNPDE